MNTAYYLASPARREKYRATAKTIIQAIDACRSVLQKIDTAETDGLSDNIDQTVHRLTEVKASVVLDFSGDKDEWCIGTKTKDRFRWRSENGFTGDHSVKRFLDANPGFVIVDEYDNEISFEAFRKVADTRSPVISHERALELLTIIINKFVDDEDQTEWETSEVLVSLGFTREELRDLGLDPEPPEDDE